MDDPERAALIEELARARVGAGRGDAVGVEASRRSPACGDEVTVRVVLAGDAITALRWDGHGCVVSTAAASALALSAPGDLADFRALADRYLGSLEPGGIGVDDVLAPFAGIGRYPLRAGCASLAWRAALEALDAG